MGFADGLMIAQGIAEGQFGLIFLGFWLAILQCGLMWLPLSLYLDDD